MVVISAAILSKSGKTLLARQFVEINRPRIDGLLAAFPKLLSSNLSSKREHTFIETPSVRYVYQPMEDLYMLIITNKSSNILEDLDALHLLAKIVADHCGRLTEEDVLIAAFDLIFAFDECFAVGYKEKLTMRQIEENLEMDSHNERIHDIMQKNREREAEEQAAEVARRLERERAAGKPFGGVGGSGGGGAGYAEPKTPVVTNKEPEGWGAREDRSTSSGGGGMKLGASTKVNKDDAFLQQVAKQDTTVKAAAASAASKAAASAAAAGSAATSSAPGKKSSVEVELTEQVTATLDKEGEISSATVKGELNICIQDAIAQVVRVRLPPADPNFSFKTHPAVDKNAFKANVLTPKDPQTQPFPVGRKVAVVTWKSKGAEAEDLTPISISCWPSPGADTTVVNMELELRHAARSLRQVVVRVPCNASRVAPVVQRATTGDYKYDARSKTLEWTVPLLDKDNSEGSLEFVVAALPNVGDLFPIQVSFVSDSIICAVEPLQAAGPNGEEFVFSKKCNLEGKIEVVNE